MKGLARALARWYEREKRDLPWRRTRDPYRIWVSEIMLQQTRVSVVIPYYERFLAAFPDLDTLARAPESEVLAAWSGLGYYSRARNLQKAARVVVAGGGGFPQSHEAIRALPGVGDYTAAAIASIAFGERVPALDGNTIRVLARVLNEPGDVRTAVTRDRLRDAAQRMLARSDPAVFNQALMELGATVCLPRTPGCDRCPLAHLCEARRQGAEAQLPIKGPRPESVRVEKTLLVIEWRGAVLMWRRGGFWELPDREQLPGAKLGAVLGRVRHTITRYRYLIQVTEAHVARAPRGFRWVARLEKALLSTLARKALDAALKPHAG